MAITNGYATQDQFEAFANFEADLHTDKIERAIEAASRDIDEHTGRHFYQDAAAARIYTPNYTDELDVDDIYNTTSLAVAQDTTGNGTFDKTWTITTDFLMYPPNPRPGRPYTRIILSRNSSQTFYQYPNEIEITANYGWAAIPTNIEQACLIQANALIFAGQSPGGVAGFSEFGVAQIRQALDPRAAQEVAPYRKPALVI